MRRLWNKFRRVDDSALNNPRFTPKVKATVRTMGFALALIPAVLHGYHNNQQEIANIEQYIEETRPSAAQLFSIYTDKQLEWELEQQQEQQEEKKSIKTPPPPQNNTPPTHQTTTANNNNNNNTLLFKNVDQTNVSYFLASSILSSYFAYRAIKASIYGRLPNIKPNSTRVGTLVKKSTNVLNRSFRGSLWSFLFAMAYINSVERVEDWLRHDRLIHSIEVVMDGNSSGQNGNGQNGNGQNGAIDQNSVLPHLKLVNQSKVGIKRTIAIIPWNESVQEQLRLYYDIGNKRELYDTGVPIEYYNRFLLFGATGYLLPKSGIIYNVEQFSNQFFRYGGDLAMIQISSHDTTNKQVDKKTDKTDEKTDDEKNDDDWIKISDLKSLSRSNRWHILLDKQYHYLLANHDGKWFLTNMFCAQHRKPLVFSPVQQLIDNLEHTYETSTILKKENATLSSSTDGGDSTTTAGSGDNGSGSSSSKKENGSTTEVNIPIHVENDGIYVELSGLVKQEEVTTLHNVFSSAKAAAFTFTEVEQAEKEE